MNISTRDALITAISYADIFDYPLSGEELRTWFPFRSDLKKSHLASLQGETLREFVHYLVTDDDTYYSLRSTRQLITTRNKRFASSVEKWQRARWVAGFLRYIPTITLVGVTGGLARSNAKEEDDIDLFILCTSKTLWITRALTTMLLDVFRLRRHPKDRRFNNLICLNMFMSKGGLVLPARERDLFSAHEVLLMTPLWDRERTHQEFLNTNRWVKRFLPNAWKQKFQTNSKFKIPNRTDFPFTDWHLVLGYCLRFVIWLLRFIEPIARVAQLRYMQQRRTTEVVNDTVIRFHPRDARVWIKKKLGSRLARFNIPLDKIFYAR